jgi:hypothetical protein
MQYQEKGRSIGTLLALISLVSTAHCEEPQYEISLRGNVLLGDGVPANDMLGFGAIGRRHLSDGWFAGMSLDTYDYDFERPSLIVGIPQDPAVKTIDASASNTVVGGFLGRQYGNRDRGFDWFWTAGLGIGFPDVSDISGPTDTGGTFDLTFDASTEIHLLTTLGTSYHFTPAWAVSLALRLEHHFMDITVTDRVTGATGNVDSQSPHGAYLSVDYSF